MTQKQNIVSVVAHPFTCIRTDERPDELFISQRDLSAWLAKSELKTTAAQGKQTLNLVREQIDSLL